MTFPNSTELLRMADTEWHNREERRGIHDEQSWKSGWISGYLTPDKPRPPGLCPQGTPVHVGSDEDYIECHSINECDYQASSDGPHPLCTREAAALAAIEAAEQEQPNDPPCSFAQWLGDKWRCDNSVSCKHQKYEIGPHSAAYVCSLQRQTPAPCPQHQIWQHCPVAGEIARKAREDVLKIIEGCISAEGFLCVDQDDPVVLVPDLNRCIGAIRSTTPHTKQEQPR